MSVSTINWLEWKDSTLQELKQRGRPVLLLVYEAEDSVGLMHPFLREILRCMENHSVLPKLLRDHFPALRIDSDAVPSYLAYLGAGSSYYLAILAPVGLTPLITWDVVTGKPELLVNGIVNALEGAGKLWGVQSAPEKKG